jgi:hypothetical protein
LTKSDRRLALDSIFLTLLINSVMFLVSRFNLKL